MGGCGDVRVLIVLKLIRYLKSVLKTFYTVRAFYLFRLAKCDLRIYFTFVAVGKFDRQ